MTEAIVIIGATLTIAIGGWYLWGRFSSTPKQHLQQTMMLPASEPPACAVPILQETIEPAAPTPSPEQRFEQQLRSLLASGIGFSEAFTRVLEACDGELEETSAFGVCAGIGRTAADMAQLLAARGYTLGQTINELGDSYDHDELLTALLPALPPGNPTERAQQLYAAVAEAWDMEPHELAPHFAAIGCAPAEILSLYYEKGEMNLGELITELRKTIAVDQAAINAFIDTSGLNPADEGIYGELREEAFTFAEMASLLRQRGESFASILDREADYANEEACDLARTLVEAGSPVSEVIDGVLDADDRSTETAAVVELAFELEMDPVALAALLRERDVNAEELDGELQERDVDFKKSIRLLHAMLFGADANSSTPQQT